MGIMALDIPDRARFQWVPSLTTAPRLSMADPKFPYVKWRDGRPRSSHGAYARALGFVDADLRHPPHDENGRPVGAWFNLQQASDFSDKRKSEIEAARRAGKLPKKTTVRKRTTIEDLLDDWSKSAEFKALSAASQSSYRKCISAILYRPQTREAAAKLRAEIRAAKLLGVAEPARELEAIATATPSSIGKPELRAFYNYAKSVRGHHMALAMIATLSAAFTLGAGKHPVAPRTQSARGHGVRSSGRPHRAGRDAGIFRVGRRGRCDRTDLDWRKLLSRAVHR